MKTPLIALPERCLAIGLMSGTSADGIDAALVEIKDAGRSVQLLAFISLPYTDGERSRLLRVAAGDFGGSMELCRLNVYLGQRMGDACLALCKQAGVGIHAITLVGSHGHTLYHEPVAVDYLGHPVRSTLQLGECAEIAERMGCPVVGDFRVRDMAAGGLGAPLVPYTEYLLYRDMDRTVALQNIGGIGNITLLPKGCTLGDVLAFDTGPGNMIIDALMERMSGGTLRFDEGGKVAASAPVSEALLVYLLEDDYLLASPPKTSGRERYGAPFVEKLAAKAATLGLSAAEQVATATAFTAQSIARSVDRFCTPRPQRLIVGGGGSYNHTLLKMLSAALPDIEVLTNEQLGLSSDAKEAIAFALLAYETLRCQPNNAPTATGASHPVIMGKISL